MIDLSREFLKFAKSPVKDFRSCVESDIMSKNAFLGREFARYNDIDGHNILSVIINPSHGVELSQQEENNSTNIQRSEIVLFCRINELAGLRKDLSVRVNGELYTVKEFHDIQGYLWRIVLEENE